MAEIKLCAVEGCGKPVHARGYCGKHNYKFVRYGDPLAGRESASPGEPARWVLEAANYCGDDCLPWPFEMNKRTGYGSIKVEGVRVPASRMVCIVAHGEPPSTKHDAAHSCGVRSCCNPRHLSWK